ncbi:MAG TPA: DUF1015 domain-containing protein [Candidatus Bathyarchaeia archaeon]|nr:DUF1015 domain-containing protein [Candidatus Bathyarchaeia archaeon]
MTEIIPFRALHYNKDKIKDLNQVVCPPYDVISEEQQRHYYKVSQYNFIRIMLAKQNAEDSKDDNRYTRSKKIYEEWLKDQILIRDENPAIYFYRQEYKVMGERHSRLGFIALMKIHSENKIYPHEKTHAAAKEDRFKLWKTVNASLSSIFVCFSDKERTVEKIFLHELAQKTPFMDISDTDGVRHIVWRVDDQKLIEGVVNTMSNQAVFIADGHHRFEVAGQIQQWKAQHNPHHTGNELYNYVMTYFTNMDSKDLQIFPMHRIVRAFPQDMAFLEEHFRIDRIKTKDELLVLLAKAGHNEHTFGLCRRNGLWLLRLKNKMLIDKVVTEGSAEYKRLDATILKYFIFDQVGITSEDIIYTKEMSDVINMVEAGTAQAGFLLNPVRIQQLKEIALNGEKMPPKTTYFYPKLLSGLTVHPFD